VIPLFANHRGNFARIAGSPDKETNKTGLARSDFSEILFDLRGFFLPKRIGPMGLFFVPSPDVDGAEAFFPTGKVGPNRGPKGN